MVVVILCQQSTESSEVFISYQHKKQPQVEALLGKLEDLGYRCWMDKKMMGVGDKLDAEIAGAIEGCQLVLSCVTPEYVASEYCWLDIYHHINQNTRTEYFYIRNYFLTLWFYYGFSVPIIVFCIIA